VDEDRVLTADIVTELANGLEKRQRFNVADRASNFDDDDVGLRGQSPNRRLDFVGDVWITCTVAPRNSPRRSFVMTFR